MKRTYLILILSLFSIIGYGQQNGDIPETTDQLSLNFLVPSIEWEVGLTDKTSLDLKIGTAFGFAKSYSESNFGFFPVLETQYRYYYNFHKRKSKGKKVSENSGNYITGVANIRSGNPIIGEMEIEDEYAVFVGPAWGMQRVYNSGFKLNLALGVGYGFNDIQESYFSPFIGIQLGWLIGK